MDQQRERERKRRNLREASPWQQSESSEDSAMRLLQEVEQQHGGALQDAGLLMRANPLHTPCTTTTTLPTSIERGQANGAAALLMSHAPRTPAIAAVGRSAEVGIHQGHRAPSCPTFIAHTFIAHTATPLSARRLRRAARWPCTPGASSPPRARRPARATAATAAGRPTGTKNLHQRRRRRARSHAPRSSPAACSPSPASGWPGPHPPLPNSPPRSRQSRTPHPSSSSTMARGPLPAS